jgi:hypothetical protein
MRRRRFTDLELCCLLLPYHEQPYAGSGLQVRAHGGYQPAGCPAARAHTIDGDLVRLLTTRRHEAVNAAAAVVSRGAPHRSRRTVHMSFLIFRLD